MGEKGNIASDSIGALDAIPLDMLKTSPEMANAWLDTYLKAREVHELQRVVVADEAVVSTADSEPKSGGAPA